MVVHRYPAGALLGGSPGANEACGVGKAIQAPDGVGDRLQREKRPPQPLSCPFPEHFCGQRCPLLVVLEIAPHFCGWQDGAR